MEYAKEAVPWFERNFGEVTPTVPGKKYQHQPLLGIIEELGELYKALADYDGSDTAGIEDAIGDVLVYETDYCRIMGRGIETMNPAIAKSDFGPYAVLDLIGQLCHSHLKMEQGIRGTKEEHLDSIYETLDLINTVLHNICWDYGLDFDQCLADTWAHVGKRDWKKFPKNGVSE